MESFFENVECNLIKIIRYVKSRQFFACFFLTVILMIKTARVYSRDYVINYTSLERDDLMIYAEGDGQLDYVQREVYAGSERIEQFTDRSNGGYGRTLYVHEDVQGNTRYYTKTNGNSFAELTYDAWGMPVSLNKLLNNDHGNYVYATIEKAGEIPPEIKAKLKQAKGFVMELVEKAQGNLLNYFHLFSGC